MPARSKTAVDPAEPPEPDLRVERRAGRRDAHRERRQAALASGDHPPIPLKMGRPPIDMPKQAVSIRLDADVLAKLRADGAGWQTRANEILRKGLTLKAVRSS